MKLGLFFTTGVSLKTWEKVGIIDREIRPYQELAKYFDEILLFTYGDKDDLKYKNLLLGNINILPKKKNIPNLIYSLLLPFLYRKELKKIDVLKTNQMIGSWSAVIAKMFFKKKLVVRQGYQWSTRESSKLIKPIICFLEKLAYKNANAIIVSSKEDKQYIQEKYSISAERINYIPNYVDTNLFKPLDIGKENRICFVGRLEKEKNLFNLIKAVSGLGTKLIIFGNGSLKDKLTSLLPLSSSNVEFRRNIPNKDLSKELNKSKLFVLSSFYEGCPKALLEAMACGLPVVGTDVHGINEIIEHKENGYLCGTDVASIKKAIIEVLNDKKLQEKMGINARKTILQNFSLERNITKEIKVYDKILAS